MLFSDAHRALIQIFWSLHVIKEQELRRIWASLSAAGDAAPASAQDVAAAVAVINQHLKSFGFDVQKGESEADNDTYYVLCNTTPDELSRAASFFPAAELQCIKKLVGAVVESDRGSLTQAEIDELVTDFHKEANLSAANSFSSAAFLHRLVAEQWLTPHPKHNGQYMLAVRAAMELRIYLNERFGQQLPECTFCSDVVFAGERCTNNRCTTRMHTKCAQEWFRTHELKCPTCTNEFKFGGE